MAEQTLYHFVGTVCFVRLEDVFQLLQPIAQRSSTTISSVSPISLPIKTVQVCQQEARAVLRIRR